MRGEHRRPAAVAEHLELPGERVEPVGVDHERDVDALHELAHERLGAGRPAEPGAEHDRVGPPDRLHAPARAPRAERAVLLGQPDEHRLEQPRGERQLEARRRGDGHVARAGAHGGQRRHRRRAGQAARAADDDDDAGGELGRRRAAARQVGSTPARMSPTSASPGAPGGMPMSITVTRAGVLLARRDPQAGLGGVERRRGGGARRPRPPPRRSRRRRRWARRRRRRVPLGGVDRRRSRRRRGPAARRSSPCRAARRRCPSRRRAAPASYGTGGGAGQAARAAPPRRRSATAASHTRSTSTSRPAWRSSRAATRPSPPLLPLPQTIAIRPGGHALGDHAREALPRALHQLERRDRRFSRSPSGRSRASARRRAAARASAAGSSQHRHRAGHALGVGERDLDRDAELGGARGARGRPAARRAARRRRRAPRRRASRRRAARAPWPPPPWRRSARRGGGRARPRSAANARSPSVNSRSASRGRRSRARARRSISSRSRPTPVTGPAGYRLFAAGQPQRPSAAAGRRRARAWRGSAGAARRGCGGACARRGGGAWTACPPSPTWPPWRARDTPPPC